MDELWRGLGEAGRLLASGDGEVWGIVVRSLLISLAATAVSLGLGVPVGAGLALARFRGRAPMVGLVHAGMGLPPVGVGLLVSLLLWRSGPLGGLGLLYTPAAMVLAQAIIATPIVAGLTLAAVQGLDPRLRLQLQALGASRAQTVGWLLREARLPLLAAVIAGFGAVISEVGAAIMVGGNIRGETRVLTTATVLEVGRGNFEVAIALTAVLLALTFGVTLALTLLQQQRRS
ncbi:MAG: Tungstate ABC transporter, permease protein [uncultured Thermomicrobiales bacterium]|uniref:Tungstate ABC transporter, permease protein n=1 Tax=uncultured Thermomicrobiales bacterium TaxID=1645740 RepID=A0A6J4VKV1_9BACT|nr:MAG: Tungstate ABC transporter, permease protein [uncultured Thermomicrobiales bacterium]